MPPGCWSQRHDLPKALPALGHKCEPPPPVLAEAGPGPAFKERGSREPPRLDSGRMQREASPEEQHGRRERRLRRWPRACPRPCAATGGATRSDELQGVIAPTPSTFGHLFSLWTM